MLSDVRIIASPSKLLGIRASKPEFGLLAHKTIHPLKTLLEVRTEARRGKPSFLPSKTEKALYGPLMRS
jgi:hypothetical protein